MRTTVTLDDDLLQQAEGYTGISEQSEILTTALEALVEREAARGSSNPQVRAAALAAWREKAAREMPAETKLRTTVTLNAALVEEAARRTGIRSRSELIEAGLLALIQRDAARRLIALGGSDPNAKAPPRRRSKPA